MRNYQVLEWENTYHSSSATDTKVTKIVAGCSAYKACQKHREYYKGYPLNYHPLTYFQEPEYKGQCRPEMSSVYLNYPLNYVKYKEPAILPHSVGRTSGIPPLPDRSLIGRFNRRPCKAYVR